MAERSNIRRDVRIAYCDALKTFGTMKIKALELPGLWNGSMSGWITIFVEVPSTTFNLVKTVWDLLKESHQVE